MWNELHKKTRCLHLEHKTLWWFVLRKIYASNIPYINCFIYVFCCSVIWFVFFLLCFALILCILMYGLIYIYICIETEMVGWLVCVYVCVCVYISRICKMTITTNEKKESTTTNYFVWMVWWHKYVLSLVSFFAFGNLLEMQLMIFVLILWFLIIDCMIGFLFFSIIFRNWFWSLLHYCADINHRLSSHCSTTRRKKNNKTTWEKNRKKITFRTVFNCVAVVWYTFNFLCSLS